MLTASTALQLSLESLLRFEVGCLVDGVLQSDAACHDEVASGLLEGADAVDEAAHQNFWLLHRAEVRELRHQLLRASCVGCDRLSIHLRELEELLLLEETISCGARKHDCFKSLPRLLRVGHRHRRDCLQRERDSVNCIGECSVSEDESLAIELALLLVARRADLSSLLDQGQGRSSARLC